MRTNSLVISMEMSPQGECGSKEERVLSTEAEAHKYVRSSKRKKAPMETDSKQPHRWKPGERDGSEARGVFRAGGSGQLCKCRLGVKTIKREKVLQKWQHGSHQ